MWSCLERRKAGRMKKKMLFLSCLSAGCMDVSSLGGSRALIGYLLSDMSVVLRSRPPCYMYCLRTMAWSSSDLCLRRRKVCGGKTGPKRFPSACVTCYIKSPRKVRLAYRRQHREVSSSGRHLHPSDTVEAAIKTQSRRQGATKYIGGAGQYAKRLALSFRYT